MENDEEKYKNYNLAEFEKELDILCRKYFVNMKFGCGCCGAGAYCKDLEFTFEIKNEY